MRGVPFDYQSRSQVEKLNNEIPLVAMNNPNFD
jgi:hypothetical protein